MGRTTINSKIEQLNGFTIPTLYSTHINNCLIEPCTEDRVWLFPGCGDSSLWVRLDSKSCLSNILTKHPNYINYMVFKSVLPNKVIFIKFHPEKITLEIKENMGYIINIGATFVSNLEVCERIEDTRRLLNGL